MKLILILVVIFTLLLGGGYYSVYEGLRLGSVSNGTTAFVVRVDETRESVLANLRQSELIRYALPFKMAYEFINGGQSFTPGGYTLPKDASALEVARALREPTETWITVSESDSIQSIASNIATITHWDDNEQKQFIRTFRAMQWNEFNEPTRELLAERFGWDDFLRSLFTSVYVPALNNLLDSYISPGDYLISDDVRFSQLAGVIIESMKLRDDNTGSQLLVTHFNEERIKFVEELMKNSLDLLPDLVTYPAKDVEIRRENGRTLLAFSTTYWNQGSGPLELIADPETEHIEGDVERTVFQRVHLRDGTHRDVTSGSFLWHEVHLHYHFSDFVIFMLESVDHETSLSGAKRKATFCVRDIESVDLSITGAPQEEVYSVCWRARQGISVGWGDSYYYTYADQNLDITDISSGEYYLIFNVNPKDRFEEITKENNFSSVRLKIDKENDTVEIVAEKGAIAQSEIFSL